MLNPIRAEDERSYEKTHKPYINVGPQLTPRFEHTLRFIAQQGAIRFDQLQKVLGRLSPDPQDMKEPGVLSEERTRKILRRWFDEELYVYKMFYARQKGWIWLTRKGYKYANVDLRYYEPAPSSLAHLYAVNDVRLLIETRRLQDVWKSERELRAEQDSTEKGSKIKHLPDAELISANGTTINAIEVELTVKAEKRLQDILYDLAANKHYTTIWYFAPPQVYAALQRALGKLPPTHRKRFVLYDLEGKVYAE